MTVGSGEQKIGGFHTVHSTVSCRFTQGCYGRAERRTNREAGMKGERSEDWVSCKIEEENKKILQIWYGGVHIHSTHSLNAIEFKLNILHEIDMACTAGRLVDSVTEDDGYTLQTNFTWQTEQ